MYGINHVGIILDGNRRFAKQLMKRPWEGHKYGLLKSIEVIRWVCEAGIKHMTAYALSLENIKTRPKRELSMILRYIGKEADNICKDKSHVVHEFNVKVRFIGRTNILPEKLQEKIKSVEKLTSKYTGHVLNVAVAYGGQQEIVDAVKNILKKGLKGIIKPSDMNEEIMRHHLWTNGQPEPDLIIRTGGEKRLSNFLPFQSAYSELFFLDRKWPEFTKEDFDSVLDEYAKRQRRFGG